VTADIRGKKVLDPRSGLTAYSDNPALCDPRLPDERALRRGGAFVDDRRRELHPGCEHLRRVGERAHGGGTTTQARYTCDGLLDVDQKPIDNLRAAAHRAAAASWSSRAGKYKLRRSSKAETPVSFTLTEDNISAPGRSASRLEAHQVQPGQGALLRRAQPGSRTSRCRSSATYRTQDNGLVLETRSSCRSPPTPTARSRSAQVVMKRSRFGITVSLTATIAALQLEVGDVVPVTHATPGWVAKLFRVARSSSSTSDEVRSRSSSTTRAPTPRRADALVSAAPATNLPDPSRGRGAGRADDHRVALPDPARPA
jgi:hypothetical protein